MLVPPSPDSAAARTLAELRRAGSAEAFFDLLGVAYDPAVLTTSRLHILKRMAAYLDGVDLARLPPEIALARARATLVKAHGDFAASSPLRERVFKVLREHAPGGAARARGAFVPLDDLFAPAARAD